MQIPPNRLDQAIAIVKAKLPGLGACPICSNPNWTLNNEIFELPPFNRPPAPISNARMPVAVLICNVCGNSLILAAQVVGLIDGATGRLVLD